MTDPTVMIGMMVKNTAEYLPNLLDQVEKLDYDKSKLRIVVEYGESNDNSLEIMQKFRDKNIIKTEIYREQIDNWIRVWKAFGAGSIYKDFQNLLQEDYFMLLDTDITEIPKDLISKLVSYNEDIVAPFVWSTNHRHFYDTWLFRIGNRRFHPMYPPGMGLTEPFEVDSVGTCFLVKRNVWKSTPIENPQPNLFFFNMARRRGFKVWADPTTEVIHDDIELKGKFHMPPPQELGFYPDNGMVSTIEKVSTLSGENIAPLEVKFMDHRTLKEVQVVALGQGMKNYMFDPDWHKKGKQWSYNLALFQMLWKTGNMGIRNAMFEDWMYPKYIEIEVTTRCNLRCKMCEHTYWKEPVADMTLDQFKGIIDQFPDLTWIGLTGIGESFLNKDFMEMLKYVKKKDVFIELYDTFYFLDEEKIKGLIDIGVDRMIASVDATTKETYEKLRVNSNYDKVWENIVRFDRYRKEIKSGRYPELCFHYIITKENQHEIIPYLHRIKDLDLDVQFVQYGRLLHSYPEIQGFFTEIPAATQQSLLDEAKKLNIQIAWNADLLVTKPPLQCCTEVFMPFIFVNGDVITCCAMNESNKREWQHSVALGNIFKEPFKDIWNGKKYMALRQKLYEAKQFPGECQDCPVYSKS